MFGNRLTVTQIFRIRGTKAYFITKYSTSYKIKVRNYFSLNQLAVSLSHCNPLLYIIYTVFGSGARGSGCDIMNTNKKWPEKMSRTDQEQLEPVLRICLCELQWSLPCPGMFISRRWEMRDSFQEGINWLRNTAAVPTCFLSTVQCLPHNTETSQSFSELKSGFNYDSQPVFV